MTKQEFTERTGIQVNDTDFNAINDLYMNAGNMDKDLFCEDYKKHGKSTIVGVYYQENSKLNDRLHKIEEERNSMISFLLDRAQEFGDIKLLEKAISLAGHAEVIRRKLAADLPLWNVDKDYIKENIQ
jgi:hypothetical protein